MELEEIDSIEKNSVPMAGPILEVLKERYGMMRARLKNELFLENNDRIFELTVEFFWETEKEETEIIKNNKIVFNELEEAFIRKGWQPWEKVNRPSSPSSDGIYLHLEVKKRFRIVTEAEKIK